MTGSGGGDSLFRMRVHLCLACFSVAGVLLGCGGGGAAPCVTTTSISPATATLDHAAAPPGNSVRFNVVTTTTGTNCVVSAVRIGYTWSVSDEVDASIVSDPTDPANGTATCKAAAPNPITVTPSPSANAVGTLVCR